MIIMSYPDIIKPGSKLYHALKDLGVEMHHSPNRPHDVLIYWSYGKIPHIPDEFINTHKMLNKGCIDVSKKRVHQLFEDIFVDPETYTGKAVASTDRQCSCDHHVVNCPTKKRDGFIYRKYINCEDENGFYRLRLYVFGKVKFAVLRHSIKDFEDKGIRAGKLELYDIKKIPVIDKINKILAKNNINICELDLLQDNDTKEYYVTDINNIAGSYKEAFYNEYNHIRIKYNTYLAKYLKRFGYEI